MATIPFRRSQPAAVKLAKGNPGRRPIKREPQPTRGDLPPPPPEYLDKRAKAEWLRVAPELHRLGLLTVCDEQILACYCQAVSRWMEAERQLKDPKTGGLTIVTSNGSLMQHPLVGIARRAKHDMLKLGIEFGLTPGGRTRLAIAEPADGDEFGELLAGDNSRAN